ncbi:MAG TPA: rod shape-determining protein MreC, partial [Gaiellaceae bacterium]|nr:rod shape-determining protein MreC [Gaiellaceae bacterium]
AVLGSSVQRAASSGYPSSRSSALKRRIVVGLLVLLSLVLITVSFRSSALDGVQGTAAGILRPFEVAADRVARPFRDAVDWGRGLVHAKSENRRLRSQIQSLQQRLTLDEGAVQENVRLRAALHYKGLPSLANFRRVHAQVAVNPQSAIDQTVAITVGTDDGVRVGSVVIDPVTNGLVGTVDRAFPSESRVTLLTDTQSAATSIDLTSPAAVGVIQPSGGGGDALAFALVSKSRVVNVGDTIVTAGSLGKSALRSIFPRGVRIGTVTSQKNSDVNPFKNIQVKPFVDFSSLQSVIVLVPNR